MGKHSPNTGEKKIRGENVLTLKKLKKIINKINKIDGIHEQNIYVTKKCKHVFKPLGVYPYCYKCKHYMMDFPELYKKIETKPSQQSCSHTNPMIAYTIITEDGKCKHCGIQVNPIEERVRIGEQITKIYKKECKPSQQECVCKCHLPYGVIHTAYIMKCIHCQPTKSSEWEKEFNEKFEFYHSSRHSKELFNSFIKTTLAQQQKRFEEMIGDDMEDAGIKLSYAMSKGASRKQYDDACARIDFRAELRKKLI